MPEPPPCRWFLVIFAAWLGASAAAAEPFVESVSPPVLECGQTTRITLIGTDLDQAEGIWFSTSGKATLAKPVESRFDRAVFDCVVD